MKRIVVATGIFLVAAFALPIRAAEKNAPGITDTEIKIGQTNPYSGPNSGLGVSGIGDQAFFKWVNDKGGINGRKVTLISLDDGYSPPRTLEQTRKLVEQDGVAFIYRSMGSAPNEAIAKYLNDRKIPQLFIASGAAAWNQPKVYPYTMTTAPIYPTEGAIYGKYILRTKPDAKIGVLYQNDDFGRDLLNGLKAGLGAKAGSMIVKEETYDVTDPTVDSQIISLQASGADVLFNFASVRAASLAIRKAYDIGWKPLQFVSSSSSFVGLVMRPAGLDKSVGLITALYAKDPTDPQWRDDPATKEWNAWMDKYYPDGDKANSTPVNSTISGAMLIQTLLQCGDDLSRENIMKQATNLHDLKPPMILPGISVNTSPTDYRPIKQMQLARFDGQRWVLFGDVIAE